MSDTHTGEQKQELAERDNDVLVLLEDVQNAQPLLEDGLCVVSSKVLQSLGGFGGALRFEQDGEIPSRRRLLEFNVAAEQVVYADRLLYGQ